ncbi:unnamed protein product [Paramecium pentaurelia]|uniref:Tetratricopeptide repeat protein n=1 Tax=Paramecium pentaurelia TaxID=43138 RepID=A0A8S1TUG4_9CILI|nr:unnamed protein product [Paramecium pentaurelia]
MQPIRPSSASQTLPKVDQKSTARKKSTYQSLFQPIIKPSALLIETPDQQLKKTQVLELLGFYEKQLMAVKGTNQEKSEVDGIFKRLNTFATTQIEKLGFHDTSILILQWIIQHKSYEEIPTQICLAYNNLSCVYRRMGQTQLALNALENALQLIQMYEQIKMETITYLNITSVLSSMNMHDKALKNSLKAIQSGKKEFDPNQIETVKYLAMANFNYGCELEQLDRLEEAVKQYKRALQFVLEHLGNHDPFFQKFHMKHHQAKQKLIVQMNQQQPGLFKTVLQLKKQYEVPTDESYQQTTPLCQTKKFSMLKKNNYMEDQNYQRDSSETIKKGMTDEEMFQDIKFQKPIEKKEEKQQQLNFKQQQDEIQSRKQSQVINKKMNQIEQIQLEAWSNSEPSDTEIKKQRINEKSPELKVSSVKINTKDQRLNFLNKQNISKQKVDDNLLEKEQQIIREIEEQIYNAESIAKIQAQFRMKKERKKFYCLKKAKKDQGELLPSDELKLKQFQRFIKRKLNELKMRDITKKIVQKNKLKKFPNTENQAYKRIISLLETYKAYKRMLLHKYIIRTRQFQTLRQSYCHPKQMVNEKIEPFRDSYIFTFGITNDDSFVRFSLVNGVKNKRKEQQYYFEMDIQSFLKSLGLLHQYIEELECFIIEENQLLKNLKNLQTVAQQFIIMNEVDGKYVVRCLTEFQTQFRLALQRTAVILQELILVDNNKLYIQGINNFEYNDVVPYEEEIRVVRPPLYTKNLSENELSSIKFIQSFMKGYLQRIRVQKWVNQKQKQIYSTNLIKTVTGHYLKIVKAQHLQNKKHYLYIINQETQKKSNDLEIKQIVFQNMGEISRENLFEILKIDLDGPSIEYSDEANYWIQKQEDYQKRGGKETYSKINKDDSIVLIQRAVLHYLLKRRCTIKKINKTKFNNSDQKNIEREILVRRAIIYGSDMNQRACLTTLYLEIERTDPTTSLMGQSEYQSVLITSKNLEHVYAFDKCVPFYQKLFYPLSRTEIITVAQRMVEVSRIVKNKKGEPKVECKSVDQVHGEILSKQGEEDDVNQKKENTLDARLKIGSTLRDKYLQQFVSCLEEDPEMKLNHQAEDNKQKNFVSALQNVFRDFKVRLAQRVKITKHVDEEDEASIKAYVQNVLPTTEYGTNPNLFNDINQDQLSDVKSQHSLKEDLDFVAEFNITLLDSLFKLQIFYQMSQQIFIVHGQSIYTSKIYKSSILKSDLINNYDIPYNYIKDNSQNIILPLIDFQDEKIIFSKDEIKLQKIVDDYLAFEFNDDKSSKKGVSIDHGIEEIPPDQITDKVVIAIYQKGTSTIFYEFHREYMIVKIIIHFNNTNEKRVVEIDTHQFQSKYVDERIKDLNNKQVIRFFKEFTRTITKVITINEKEHTHNFEDLRGDLSLFLREKFVQKIQGMLMVKRMVEKFKLYKQLKRSKLHIHKFIVNSGQHYIEISYFLIKQSSNLQLTMRELTFVTPQGHLVERSKTLKSKRRLREKQFLINLEKLSQQSDQLINSQSKRQDQLDLQRIDFQILSKYDQMKTIQYYRSLMTPLISIIQKNLVINFNKFQFSLTLPIIMIESHIMKKKKKNYSHETKFQLMTYAVIAAQSSFRKKLLKKWLQTKLARKRQIEEKNKHLGEFIKRSFKQIREDDEGHYYIINVYKQPGKISNQTIYTFELIPINKSQRKTKMRASYSYDNFQLIDVGSQSLANHFINKIYIEKGIIKFDEYSFQNVQDEGVSTTFDENLQHEQQNINVDEKMIEKDAQEILIDQEKQGNTLINIVYTNSKQLLDKKSYDDSQNNVTKLQVDLQSIKKLYPNFNVKDPNTVKILSQNLRKGVKMDQFAGSLMIDKSRIQSSLINPLSVGVQRLESQNYIQSQYQISSNINRSMRLSQRPYATNVLAKETMYYTGKKYLIVISQVKNKIQKILNQDRDSVFEDHERILEIKAQNLKERQEPFSWYLTPDDAEILTHEKSPENMAKVLTKNLQIINSKFIYLCFNQQDQQRVKLKPDDNVILFVESTIRPMQTKFRNRRIFSNYKEYRKTLTRSRADGTLILHLANNLNTTKRMFVILFIEEKESSIQLKSWDATEQMYFCETELQLKKYQSIYFQDKQKCLKALLNFLEFRSEQNKIQFLHPKPEQVQDYFEKEKKLSIHSSSKIGSPTKSVDQNNEQQMKFFQQEHTPMQSPMIAIENLDDDEIQEVQEDVIQQ